MKIRSKLTALIVLTTILSLSLAGCSMSIGGNSPQKKPEVAKDEIEKSVKKEMSTPETQKIIEDAAKTQKLEDLLLTPDADKLVQKKIIDNFDTPQVSAKLQQDMKQVLSSPDTQKQFQAHVSKSMETPEVQKALTAAVQKAMMQILQGGGGKSSGGSQSGGSGQSGGGSQSGGGGSGQ